MAAVSTAESLGTVALACATVADNLNTLNNEHPHTLRKVTLAGGKASFRFNTVVTIKGEQVEVQVRTLK